PCLPRFPFAFFCILPRRCVSARRPRTRLLDSARLDSISNSIRLLRAPARTHHTRATLSVGFHSPPGRRPCAAPSTPIPAGHFSSLEISLLSPPISQSRRAVTKAPPQ